MGKSEGGVRPAVAAAAAQQVAAARLTYAGVRAQGSIPDRASSRGGSPWARARGSRASGRGGRAAARQPGRVVTRGLRIAYCHASESHTSESSPCSTFRHRRSSASLHELPLGVESRRKGYRRRRRRAQSSFDSERSSKRSDGPSPSLLTD